MVDNVLEISYWDKLWFAKLKPTNLGRYVVTTSQNTSDEPKSACAGMVCSTYSAIKNICMSCVTPGFRDNLSVRQRVHVYWNIISAPNRQQQALQHCLSIIICRMQDIYTISSRDTCHTALASNSNDKTYCARKASKQGLTCGRGIALQKNKHTARWVLTMVLVMMNTNAKSNWGGWNLDHGITRTALYRISYPGQCFCFIRNVC